MKKVSLLFVFLLSCAIAFSQSIFLYAGNDLSTDTPLGEPVMSYSLGSPDASGNIHELTVTIGLGQVAQELFTATAQGTLFNKMELRFYDNGKRINRFTMQDVVVSSAQVSGTNQIVTLSFNKIKF